MTVQLAHARQWLVTCEIAACRASLQVNADSPEDARRRAVEVFGWQDAGGLHCRRHKSTEEQ